MSLPNLSTLNTLNSIQRPRARARNEEEADGGASPLQNLPPEVFQNIVLNMVTNGTTDVCVDMARVCKTWGTACDDDILYQQALQVLKMPREAMKNVSKWKEHFNGVCREDKKLRDAKGWMRRGILAASLDWENGKFQLHTAMRRLDGFVYLPAGPVPADGLSLQYEYPHLMWLMSARGGNAELAHEPVPNGASKRAFWNELTTLGPPYTHPTYGPIAEWDVADETDMGDMFADDTSFNGDLSKWDVSNVIDMKRMFFNNSSFKGDLSKWDVSNVIDMGGMFFRADIFNSDISEWDVSNVKSMSAMFYRALEFEGNLSKWNVSKVENMAYMFRRALNFNSNLSKWNVSSVYTMKNMFRHAVNFNGNLSNWNVSKVRDMSAMFDGAENFNRNLSKWNVSKVRDMAYMFKDATSFNKKYVSEWILHRDTYNRAVHLYLMLGDTVDDEDFHEFSEGELGDSDDWNSADDEEMG